MPLFQQSPELLSLFRAGDSRALARVYTCYVETVRRSVRWHLGHRAHEADLEDLVHQSFLEAFEPRARSAYDPRRPFSPYLIGLTRHLVTDWLRARARELPTCDARLQDIAEPPAEETAPYSHPRLVQEAERFVHNLTGDVRAIHEKRYVTAMSQRQAARCLGLSRQTVRTLEARLHRALAHQLRHQDLLADGAAQTPSESHPDRSARS